MEFGEWNIYYKEILDDFGFSRGDDEKCGQLLDEILAEEGCLTLEDLSKIAKDKFQRTKDFKKHKTSSWSRYLKTPAASDKKEVENWNLSINQYC